MAIVVDRGSNIIRPILALVLAALIAACAEPTPLHRLPTTSVPMDGCLGTGYEELTVTGDPQDTRVAWLMFQGKERREAVWPPGFVARFAPSLEILDGSGQVVLREGQAVTEGCLLEDGNVTYVSPPF